MFNCWHHTAKERALTWTTIPVDASQKLQISIRQSKGTSSIVPQSKLYGSEPKRTCIARRSAREVLILRPIGHMLRMQTHSYFRSPQKSVMLSSSHTEVCLYEQLLFLVDQFLFSKNFDWFLAFVLELLKRTYNG